MVRFLQDACLTKALRRLSWSARVLKNMHSQPKLSGQNRTSIEPNSKRLTTALKHKGTISYYRLTSQFAGHRQLEATKPSFDEACTLQRTSELTHRSGKQMCSRSSWNKVEAVKSAAKCNSRVNRNFFDRIPLL